VDGNLRALVKGASIGVPFFGGKGGFGFGGWGGFRGGHGFDGGFNGGFEMPRGTAAGGL
jgi:hypothetical protein